MKSKVYFSPNVLEEDKVVLAHQLGIIETNNLGKYLGFPLRHKGRNRNKFQFVIDRVQAKLAGWKTHCLSRAGRLVLHKAVVTPIANYYMQCCYLQESVRELTSSLETSYGARMRKKEDFISLVGRK